VSGLSEPIHVCFVTGEYPPMRGGVGDYTRRVAMALGALGVRCSVVTGRAARAAGRTRGPLEPAVYPAVERWSWSGWGHLAALLDDLRPDVLHIQYQTGAFGMEPALNLLPWRLRLGGSRTPVALTYHDLKVPYLFPKAGPVRGLANQVLQSAAGSAIVTNQEDLLRIVRPEKLASPAPWPDRSRRRKVDLIPIGSNIDPVPMDDGARAAVRARLGLDDGEVAIGFFGFVDPWKGVDRLAEAFGRLVERGLPVRLVFVGGAREAGAASPYERGVREQLAAAGLTRRCVWTGYATPEETSEYLQALDVCALPFAAGACYRHGTLIAAIAHGLPIVTTRQSPEAAALEVGLPPLVHGESAMLVGADDTAELTEALAVLAESQGLRGRLRRGAAALAPYFEWERIARMSLVIYERLLVRADAPVPGGVPSPSGRGTR
jgi:glycosyltransferase involved in cell wall biosynthesis